MLILNSCVLTPRSFVPDAEQQQVVQLICALDEAILPQRYGFWEPLRTPFDPGILGELDAQWEDTVHFTRRRPRIDIDASPAWGGPAPIHGCVAIRAESATKHFKSILDFNLALSETFVADFTLVHIVADEEQERAKASQTVSRYSNDGKDLVLVSTHKLLRFLPDLYWGTVFGPPYIDLFGEEKLLTAPAPIVKKLDYGGIYIQLSDSPYDFVEDYNRLEEIRIAVKNHLGANAFFDPSLPKNHKYDVPVFKLDSENYRKRPEEWG